MFGLSRYKMILLILAGTAALILYISEQVYIYSLETTVFELRSERVQCQEEVDRLRIEAAALSTGARIQKIAMKHLGMKLPEGAPDRLF